MNQRWNSTDPRHWRHDDWLFAARTVNLLTRIAGVALNVLPALHTVELEFSHKYNLFAADVPRFGFNFAIVNQESQACLIQFIDIALLRSHEMTRDEPVY